MWMLGDLHKPLLLLEGTCTSASTTHWRDTYTHTYTHWHCWIQFHCLAGYLLIANTGFPHVRKQLHITAIAARPSVETSSNSRTPGGPAVFLWVWLKNHSAPWPPWFLIFLLQTQGFLVTLCWAPSLILLYKKIGTCFPRLSLLICDCDSVSCAKEHVVLHQIRSSFTQAFGKTSFGFCLESGTRSTFLLPYTSQNKTKQNWETRIRLESLEHFEKKRICCENGITKKKCKK